MVSFDVSPLIIASLWFKITLQAKLCSWHRGLLDLLERNTYIGVDDHEVSLKTGRNYSQLEESVIFKIGVAFTLDLQAGFYSRYRCRYVSIDAEFS